MTQSKVRVLDDQTINKIAAGEVIENPASVVKELVENSLDAGAMNLCVEINEGGRQLIRVSDDGCGMSQDDALLCLERHATSKIRQVEDIIDLSTMGFRGEAIPSIAAISKFTLLTRSRTEQGQKNEEGTLIFVEGGRLVSCTPANRDPGTTMMVKSLFYNVPVRRKFQKSPSYDSQEILKTLGLLALAHPTVQFELISDQKSLLKTTPNAQSSSFQDLLKKRLEVVLGNDYASSLLDLNFQQNPFELEGFIGLPETHKLNRTGQHLFINQRLVYSPLISTAVREGYGTMLPSNRYPLFVLHLRMPGSLLDVNVHPQKKEVRLRQEHQLREMIIHAVQTALRREQNHHQFLPKSEDDLPPFWTSYSSLLSPKTQALQMQEETWEFKSVPSNPLLPSAPISDQSVPSSSISFNNHSAFYPAPTHLQKTAPKSSHCDLSSFIVSATPRVLTTLSGYCILDPFNLNQKLFNHLCNKREGGLALLDQRAAYARIHYEQLLNKSDVKETQPLLVPLTIQLTAYESGIVLEHLSSLNRLGFSLREFGEQTFLIDAFPQFLKQDEVQDCMNLLIQDLIDMQTSRRMQMQKEEQLALVACRASIPSTKQLTIEEAQALVEQLLKCEMPAQCPLGKSTCVYLAPDEIAKFFQKA